MRAFLISLSLTALLVLSIALNQQVALAQESPAGNKNRLTVTIDVLPRISTVIVDDRLYLPSELPISFTSARENFHTVIIEDGEINETPNKRYVFERWTDLSEERNRIIRVNKDINIKAIFKEQYYLKLISEYGFVYGSRWYDNGETAVFGVKPTNVLDDQQEGHRFAFVSWNGGDSPKSPTNSLVIQEPMTVRATWADQYYLDVASSLEGGAVAGSGWYDKGQKVTLISDQEVDTGMQDMKYVFDGWSSVGNYPAIVKAPQTKEGYATLAMDNPYKVEAKWKKAYYLNIQTPYGSATGNGFYKEGSFATISVSPAEVVTKQNKEQMVFDGWKGKGVEVTGSESANGQVRITEPATVVAKWKPQYYLSVSSGEGGTASGSGWYDVGSVVSIGANEKPSQPSSFWIKTAFDRWTGDISADTSRTSITMDSPKTVKAQWKDDYSPAFMNGGILAAVAIAGVVGYRKFRKAKKVRHPRPELLGGEISPAELADPAWKQWRAKLVDRTPDESEPKR